MLNETYCLKPRNETQEPVTGPSGKCFPTVKQRKQKVSMCLWRRDENENPRLWIFLILPNLLMASMVTESSRQEKLSDYLAQMAVKSKRSVQRSPQRKCN